MPTKLELRQLARTRLKEAKTLFVNGYFDGAYYLAGYVVELSLKARICRILDLANYPDRGKFAKSFKEHDLDHLMMLAGLKQKFKHAKKSNPTLITNWSILTDWSVEHRYKFAGTSQKQRAQNIIDALQDKNDGVFTWIKKYW